MKNFFLKSYLLALVFLMYGCQLNQEIAEIRDNIREKLIPSNDDQYVIKNEEKQSKTKKELNENNKEEIELIKKDKKTENIEKKFLKYDNSENQEIIQDEKFALVQPKLTQKKLEEIKKKKLNFVLPNKIGVLLPMTGTRSHVGRYVTNSIRLKILDSSLNKEFMIFDTKGTPEGTKEAFLNAISKKINLFIGPVFSDSTNSIKELSDKYNIPVFSLSNNENLISSNLYITGINIREELDCIFRNLNGSEINNLGIIQYKSKSSQNINQIIRSIDPEINKEFVVLDNNMSVEKVLKDFSKFDERQQQLNQEKIRVNNSDLSEELKNIEIKKLSVLDTYGELPFDALIINATGNRLLEIMSLLAYYDINSSNTLIIGTSIWENFKSYEENIFEDAYFVSSKSKKRFGYDSKYQSNFDTTPNNLNYLTHDLLKLFELIEDEGKFLSIKFEGILGTTEILDNNSFSRDIYLKKYKNGKVINIGECKNIVLGI